MVGVAPGKVGLLLKLAAVLPPFTAFRLHGEMFSPTRPSSTPSHSQPSIHIYSSIRHSSDISDISFYQPRSPTLDLPVCLHHFSLTSCRPQKVSVLPSFLTSTAFSQHDHISIWAQCVLESLPFSSPRTRIPPSRFWDNELGLSARPRNPQRFVDRIMPLSILNILQKPS
ncbi:hypothetical protein IWX48DRAFT_463569 [Phyllosticta citricarpa]